MQGRAYIFLGPEIGEKEEALAELRSRLGGGEAPEESSWYAGEAPAALICDRIRNGSLFSARRLFLIKSAEGLKKDDAELLASCLEQLQDDTFVVLVSGETKIDARLERAVDPKNKRIFWELFEDRKAGWVSDFFRREGFGISPEGIDTVLELVENNTAALRQECSRLCLFIEKGRVIEAGDVEKWFSHSRGETAFTLFSRIASGDLSRSIETLRALSAAKEAPSAIVAGLVWCFRRFRDYLELTASGRTGDADFRKAGLGSSRMRRDYAALARRAKSAANGLALLGEFELLIRQSGAPAEGFLLDLLVYKLVCGPERPRETWPRF